MKDKSFSAGDNLDAYDIMPTARQFNRFTLRSHVRGICNGNFAAGAVLDFLLFRHKRKVGMAFDSGDIKDLRDLERAQQDGLFDMYHTKESIHAFFDGLYSKPTLVAAERVLIVLGYIKIYKKHNKSHTDNTNHYHLNGQVLRDALAHYWECKDNGIRPVFPLDENSPSLKTLRTNDKNLTDERQKLVEHSLRIQPKDNSLRREDTTTSCRDEGPSGASSIQEIAIAPLAVNTQPNQTTAIKLPGNTPAYSKKSKPRHKPGPLPAHAAIPFMQDLARTLAPILSNPAHAEYPTEGSLAYKYHLDALEAYDAIQTGAIFARTLDKPERYTSPTAWGNAYRLEQLKLWAKDPKAMEASLLAAARIYASMRSTNMVAVKLPNVAAFLFGSTTAGGFLPWWNHVKPFEEMEAKEQKVLKRVEQDEQAKTRYLTMEEKGHIEPGDFEHKRFLKLFGREPNKFKEIKK